MHSLMIILEISFNFECLVLRLCANVSLYVHYFSSAIDNFPLWLPVFVFLFTIYVVSQVFISLCLFLWFYKGWTSVLNGIYMLGVTVMGKCKSTYPLFFVIFWHFFTSRICISNIYLVSQVFISLCILLWFY